MVRQEINLTRKDCSDLVWMLDDWLKYAEENDYVANADTDGERKSQERTIKLAKRLRSFAQERIREGDQHGSVVA